MQTLSDPAVATQLACWPYKEREKNKPQFLIKKRESADDPNVIALIDELLEKNFQWKTKKEINAKKFVRNTSRIKNDANYSCLAAQPEQLFLFA
jgi:hypothetical protein